MDHLEDERPSGAHLDLPDVESEPEKGFKERALAVRLATNGDDLWDRELLAEGHSGGLKAVVGLESHSEIGRGSGRH